MIFSNSLDSANACDEHSFMLNSTVMEATGPVLRLNKNGDVPYYRLLPWEAYPQLTHAIFTRHGGISRRPFASLNLSWATGDDHETVEENHRLALAAIALTKRQTVSCHLEHGNHVQRVDKSNLGHDLGYADGMVTDTAGVYLLMRYADCVPLMAYDPQRKAVGIAHAGWRGTFKKVAAALIAAMGEHFHSQPEVIQVFIGPSIGPCCYVVGEEALQALRRIEDDTAGLLTQENGGHAHLDLWELNRRQLSAAGVRQIITSGFCTSCMVGQFYSHRAENGRTGRFGMIIGLKDEGDDQR
jgi:polyphenol oxidase